MVASGERMDFTDLRRDGKPLALVDKHSTGGVGDKITIPLVPVVMPPAAARCRRPPGRGLGHTGGTLDKLESIAGFTAESANSADPPTTLRPSARRSSRPGDLAPADRKLYALRDVTGTAESLPLIASSVMSKKLAEGAGALVLDVKVGSRGVPEDGGGVPRAGAHHGRARRRRTGCATRALLTDMDTPAGPDRRQRVEVAESLEVLAGGGPPDVVELTLALAARDARRWPGIDGVDPAQTLRDGTAMDRFRALVAAQGGDLVAAVAGRCAFRDRDRHPRRHDGRHRRDGGGTGGVAARGGPLAPGRAGAVRRRRAHPPPARRARRRGRAAVHALHRHPGTVRRRDGRTRRRLERRRRRPRAAAARSSIGSRA